MQYKDTEARCLFCEATVEGNQESMAGRWCSPHDLVPEWKSGEDKTGRHWLWYGAGSPDTYQDFYLCSKHNDPHYFHAAMKWAAEQLKQGEYIDFTKLEAIPIPALQSYERWVEVERSLLDQVPELSEAQRREKSPNAWQIRDLRLDGCLEISWAITDIIDGCSSRVLLDYLALPDLPKPLELVEALKRAAKNIEVLTISGDLVQEKSKPK